MKNFLFIILAGLVCVGGLFTLYLLYTPVSQSNLLTDATSNGINDVPEIIKPTLLELAENGIFFHKELGWQLRLPLTTEIERFDEVSEAETIVFFDVESKREFQLYITPYTETEITDEQLNLDIPSGIIRDPKTIILENRQEAMLFSTEVPGLGEVKELWFIHEGHLYEFTVKAEWESWFGEIMRSWQLTS